MACMSDKSKIQITHIMADGTVRESIEGVVIQNEQFYQVIQGIIEKQKSRKTQKLHTN